MKKILFSLCLMISGFGASSQNAFWDAQKICSLLKSNKTDEIIEILLCYQKADQAFPWAKLSRKYPDHIKQLKDSNESFRLRNFFKLLKNESEMMEKVNSLNQGSQDIELFRDAVKHYYEVLTTVKERNQLQEALENGLKNESGPPNQIPAQFRKYQIDALYRHAQSQQIRDTLMILEDPETFRQNSNKFIWNLMADSNAVILDQEIEELDIQRSRLAEMFRNKQIFDAFFPAMDYEKELTVMSDFRDKAETMRINSERLRSDLITSAPPASFKLPSQSEMIDALAIYLAKRVKQEVAISFIEKLTVYMRDQSLVNQLFPATLNLLNNREAFMRPNFGTSWQIALSEDFIRIPENLPKCLPPRYQSTGLYLKDGIRIGQLVQQHYSFIEAVNYLYEEPLETPVLRNANAWMYIVNHELFEHAERQTNRYWITAEKLQSLNKEQLEWMYILLDVRYGDLFNEIFAQEWRGREIWDENYFVKKIYPFRNWMTRILVQLNQFEKTIAQRTEDQEAGKDGLSGFWKFQNDLMEAVLDSNFIHVNKNITKGIQFTRSVFCLYSGIEQKNYASVVDQVLKVFSLLELDKHVGMMDVLANQSFRVALRQKEEKIQDTIQSLFNRLDSYYDQISNFRYPAMMAANYIQIKDALKLKGRESELAIQQDPDQLLEWMFKKIKNDEQVSMLKVLLKETMINEILNNASRHTELNKLLLRSQILFDSLKKSHAYSMQALGVLDTLKMELDKYDLLKDKYAGIAIDQWKSFAGQKLFSFESPIFKNYLSRMGQQTHDKRIRTALSFLSDVMQSGNAQNLSKVVESYSLPPSSYKIKRHSRFSIHIDAMVGAYGGIEAVKDARGDIVYSPVGGLSAPIGLSLSWGKRDRLKEKAEHFHDGDFGFVNRHGRFKKLKGYNLIILMSVIDIGAAVSYRITNDNNGGLPVKAKWSQVFSPGITSLIGIKGMPLCVGAGMRFTPNLRTLDGNLQRNALRLEVGLYFDLPLVNVFYR